MTTLLSIKNLSVSIGNKYLIQGISLTISAGECLAIVGESGSGKSITALAILGLLPSGIKSSGSIEWYKNKEKELWLKLSDEEMRLRRGKEISIIFQEPLPALNPLHRIEKQIDEAIYLKQPRLSKEKRSKMIDSLLKDVKVTDSKRIRRSFPHELSGGQLQRIVIAMALANKPRLLIADEPTSALDASTRKEMLELLKSLQKEKNISLIFISHDWETVKKLADKLLIVDNGKMIAQGGISEILKNRKKFLTRFSPLQKSNTRKNFSDKFKTHQDKQITKNQNSEVETKILQVSNLKVLFPIKKGLLKRISGYVEALQNISFDLEAGQTIGVVGESGAGKSTLGMALLRLNEAEGKIKFLNESLLDLEGKKLKQIRKYIQWVPQDPFSSLSPRLLIGDIVAEGLQVYSPNLSKKQRWQKVAVALSNCGLSKEIMYRYVHELSGGQRQRVAIARVLVLEAKLIILDEPTSALDLVTTRGVLDLLKDLQTRFNVAYIIISHDIQVIAATAHSVLVLKDGWCVEQGLTENILNNPQHEYTTSLMQASIL